MAEAPAIARDQIALARRGASRSIELAQRGFRRHVQGQTQTTMDLADLDVDGHRMHYAVSSNDQKDPSQIWAVNIHGFFAGGAMYHRESERLAEALGWRVVNPSLPGFGGSDPLSWKEISMEALSRRIEALLDHLGIDRAVLLGHSMGGGVAVEFASRYPDRVLGIIYRDGVATPAWHHRHGVIPLVLSAVVPDVAPVADLAASVIFDLPDLLIGRLLSTLRSVIPDLRRNFKTLARTAPVGTMLMEADLTEEVVGLRLSGIPVLEEWGCFDRITTPAAATEFAELAEVEVQWIPGGHSWMLARPSGQSDVLRYLPLGIRFLEDVAKRVEGIDPHRPHLRSVS